MRKEYKELYDYLDNLIETEIKGIWDNFANSYSIEEEEIYEAGYMKACEVMQKKLNWLKGGKCEHFLVDNLDGGEVCLYCD